MAVGNMTKAARILKPRRSITSAPRSTNPSMTPSMNAKLPRNAIHGTNPTHRAQKPGDNKAAALMRMRIAEISSKATAVNRDLNSENGCGNGPYTTPPGGTPAGGSGAACVIAGDIGRGTVVW